MEEQRQVEEEQRQMAAGPSSFFQGDSMSYPGSAEQLDKSKECTGTRSVDRKDG